MLGVPFAGGRFGGEVQPMARAAEQVNHLHAIVGCRREPPVANAVAHASRHDANASAAFQSRRREVLGRDGAH